MFYILLFACVHQPPPEPTFTDTVAPFQKVETVVGLAGREVQLQITGRDPLESHSWNGRGVLYVKVVDAERHFISGIRNNQWHVDVRERGPCEVSGVSHMVVSEGKSQTAGPLAIASVNDFSGSMQKYESTLVRSVREMVQAVRPQDMLGIVNFDHRIELASPLAAKPEIDTTSLSDAFNRLGKRTALYNGIGRGLTLLEGTSGRRIAVVFSDGKNNVLGVSPRLLAQRAQAENIAVFPFAFGDHPNVEDLGMLASVTGGELARLSSPNDFVPAFIDAARIRQDYYRVEFDWQRRCSPTDSPFDVEVSLRLPKGGWVSDSYTITWDVNALPRGPHDAVHFDFDSSVVPVVDTATAKLLDAAAAALSSPWAPMLVLHGYADSKGSPEYNRKLAEARVGAVRQALIDHGARPQSIQVKVHGESGSIFAPDYPDESKAAVNRRVEFEWVIRSVVER